MKIAILGYGKMGKEIEKLALEHNHTIKLIIDNENDWSAKADQLGDCDVAIEFSMPAIAVENIRRCFEAGTPVVVGTTGWQEQLQPISELCISKNGTLFYASNFSIGANIFFEVNRRLASLLETYPMYSPNILEIHHIQKLDAPSGTAITLAKGITDVNTRFKKWTAADPQPGEIPVKSIREGSVPGTHTVTWDSDIDQITITHEAKGRRGLALGAVMAAEWVVKRKGVFTMQDMLKT